MAIISVTKLPDGHTNETTVEGTTYSVTYQIEVDSLDDQTVAIMQNGNFPNLGELYNFSDSEFDGNAVLTSISIARAGDDSRLLWHAVCKYETREGDWPGGGNINGEPEKDPLKWHDEIDIGFSQYTAPAEVAHYIRGFTGTAAIMYPDDPETVDNPGDVMVPMNSSFDVFDPPIEREECILNLKITKNMSYFPTIDAMKYQNRVNSDDFTISKPDYGFELAVEKYQAKINNITGTFHFENGVKYWKVTIHVDLKPSWRVQVLDRGFHRRFLEGDSDHAPPEPGSPGYVGGQEMPVHKKRFVDPDGKPIVDPVLLDGDGDPLSTAKIKAHAFVYLTYAIYYEIPFAEINW